MKFRLVACDSDCSNGHQEGRCNYCLCNDDVFGQVLSETNLPVKNATFSPTIAPYIITNQSVVGGYFMLQGICFGDTFIVGGDGYVDTEILLLDEYMNITLQSVGKSSM